MVCAGAEQQTGAVENGVCLTALKLVRGGGGYGQGQTGERGGGGTGSDSSAPKLIDLDGKCNDTQ